MDKKIDPIVECNVELLRSRSAVGIGKYGTTLADSNAPMRERLGHALLEALDQANYLQWAIQACDQPTAAPQVVADERAALQRESFAFHEWLQKTEWVQKNIDSFPLDLLGKHRADVMREEIERLRAAAPVRDDSAAKANFWFDCLHKCAKLLELADDTPIPSGVVAAVEKLMAAPVQASNPVEFDGIKTAPVQAQEPIGYAPDYLTERLAAGDSAVMLTVTRKPLPGHGVNTALFTAPVQPVARPDGWREAFIKDILLSVAEIPDRDSPEDQPEMMLVTGDELRGIIESHLEAIQHAAPAAQGDDHVLTRAELAAYRKMAYDEGVSVGAAQGDAKAAINAELAAALKDIADDISERFDMESSSTNPGIKNCVERARAAIAAKAAS